MYKSALGVDMPFFDHTLLSMVDLIAGMSTLELE